MIPLVVTDVLRGLSNSIHVWHLTTLEGRLRKIEKVTKSKNSCFHIIQMKNVCIRSMNRGNLLHQRQQQQLQAKSGKMKNIVAAPSDTFLSTCCVWQRTAMNNQSQYLWRPY